MAIQLQPGEKDLRRVVDSVRQLNDGRQNSVGDVTLRPGQTTTTVNFENCSTECRVFLEAQTLNAAAAVATTFIPRANILRGSFTIVHASSANADLTFSFTCLGG